MSLQYFALIEIEQVAAIVRAGHDSGVTAALGEAPVSAEEIARRIGGHELACRQVLNVLEGLGYARLTEQGFVASRELSDMRRDQSFNWKHLPRYIETGKPWKEIDKTLEDLDDFYVNFFGEVDYGEKMLSVAQAVAARLETRPRRILDIGAGTGVWSLAMAARLPEACVTGVDLPDVLQTHFKQRAAMLGLGGRIDVRPGDFHLLDYPEGAYDRVVMGQSYHFVREKESAGFLARISGTLSPGGELVIIHHFADATQQKKLSRSLYEVRLSMRSKSTKNYSPSEMEAMCGRAGLRLVNSFDVEGPGFLSVIVFEKPRAGR